MRKYWIIIALCVSSLCSSDARVPTAKFSNITVRGIVKTTRKGRDVDSFMGIPYAEPPIGPLRFSNPVPKVYPDRSTLIADKPHIRCLQSIASIIGDANSTRYIKGDEDCLYLSIHRPASAENEPLPVMVYFQAADLFPGIKDVSYIGPDYLLDGDIVLVTLTYRLGVFGFLCTDDRAAPGNYGLKDQKLALEWIQSNIAGFGGDPNRVTLFGQGEAAKLIHLHALVNHTAGLFHQYILQGGTALAPWSVHDRQISMIWTARLAVLNKCEVYPDLEMLDCLRKIDSRELLESSYKQFSITDINFNRMWGPVKERPWKTGTFLKECPAKLLAGQRDLPFIAGLTYEQNSLTVSARIDDDEWIPQNLLLSEDTYHLILGYSDIHERVKKFYRFGNWEGSGPPVKDFIMATLFSNFRGSREFLEDCTHSSPQIKMLEERRENSKSPFYFYSFEYRGQFSTADWLYKTHGAGAASQGDDLLYLFYHDKAEFPESKYYDMNYNDFQMVDTMVELWTSFATRGVPRSRYVKLWRPYGSVGEYMRIGDLARPVAVPGSKYRPIRMMQWENITLHTCD